MKQIYILPKKIAKTKQIHIPPWPKLDKLLQMMEHFDKVYNKLTEQIGQKWTTGSDPEVIVSALLWEISPPKKKFKC